jgi:hypothetical protein
LAAFWAGQTNNFALNETNSNTSAAATIQLTIHRLRRFVEAAPGPTAAGPKGSAALKTWRAT